MKVLVIGDSCKDVFVYGKCDRLAPAAPVPVFVPQYQRENRGMAANVYENLLSFKVDVDLVTNTTEIVKTRYVEEKTNHMVIRVDSGEEKIEKIKDIELYSYSDYDAIIISDYDKGFLSEEDIEYISSQHPVTFLDTKKILGNWCKNITFIKINEFEYDRTKHMLDKDMNNKMIITLGPHGAKYLGRTYPVPKVEIKDTSGAGDTFIAGLCVKYAETKNLEESIRYANYCATLAVQKKGVSVA